MQPLQPPLSRFILVTLLVLCVLLSGCAKKVNSRLPATASAAAMLQLDDEKPTEKLLDKSADALMERGIGYLATGNFGLARLHFTTALQKQPERSDAFLGLARIEERTGSSSQARLYYRHALKHSPENITALVGIVRTYRYDDKLDDAEIAMQRALEVDAADLRVLSERAILHDLQGRPELADPIYRQIIAHNPQQASTLNNLGISQVLRENYAAAVVSFRRALQLDRNNPRIKNNLAMVYALNGDEDSALRLFADTVGEAAAYNNLGYLYMTAGRLEEAERALHKAMQLNPRFYVKAQQNLDRLKQLRNAGQ